MSGEVVPVDGDLVVPRSDPRQGVIDRVLLAIDRLPGPASAWYLAIGLLVAGIATAGAWLLAPERPLLSTFRDMAVPALVFAWFAWLTHVLNVIAARAFDDFRPALAEPRLEEDYRRSLTSIDDRNALLAVVATLVVVAIGYNVGVRPFRGPLAPEIEILSQPLWGLAAAMLGIVIYHTVRQLRLVSRLSAIARNIDIFKPQPLNGFARLSSVGAIGLIAFVVVFMVFSPDQPLPYVIQEVALLVIAVGLFVLPLRVMHGRLAAEKSRLESASQDRIKAQLARIHAAVDSGDMTHSQQLREALSALLAERDVLARLHTWPWSAGTFRGFASALLLPVMLIVFTQFIDRLI